LLCTAEKTLFNILRANPLNMSYNLINMATNEHAKELVINYYTGVGYGY